MQRISIFVLIGLLALIAWPSSRQSQAEGDYSIYLPALMVGHQSPSLRDTSLPNLKAASGFSNAGNATGFLLTNDPANLASQPLKEGNTWAVFGAYNEGPADAATFRMRLTLDASMQTAEMICAGLVKTSTCLASAFLGNVARGEHVMRLIIDSDNAIPEWDETDNIVERREIWLAPATPTPSPPIISSISPSVGQSRDQAITITGSHFGAPQSAVNGSVLIGTTSVTNLILWTDNTIVVTIPTNMTPGVVPILIFSRGLSSSPAFYTINP